MNKEKERKDCLLKFEFTEYDIYIMCEKIKKLIKDKYDNTLTDFDMGEIAGLIFKQLKLAEICRKMEQQPFYKNYSELSKQYLAIGVDGEIKCIKKKTNLFDKEDEK